MREWAVAAMSRMHKALAVLLALGVGAWFTLDDVPLGVGNYRVGLRTATLVILGLFAFRVWLHGYRLKLEAEADPDREM